MQVPTPKSLNLNISRQQVGSLDYLDHTPGGGDVVLPKNDVRWRAKSKINSLSSLRIEKRLLRELELYEDCITGSLGNSFKFLVDISLFCGTTDTPVLDFW